MSNNHPPIRDSSQAHEHSDSPANSETRLTEIECGKKKLPIATRTCPSCGESIKVGTGGAKNLEQHQGSRTCLETQKKKKKTTLITAFFQPRQQPAAEAVIEQRAPPAPQPALLPNPEPDFPDPPEYWAISDDPEENTSSIRLSLPPNSPLRVESPSAPATAESESASQDLAVLTRIRALERLLPETVSNAAPDDHMWLVGALNPAQYAEHHCELPADDWEVLGPLMHRVFGYSEPIPVLARRVRRGPDGVEGLCSFIEYFVRERQLDPALMEGKLAALEQAMGTL